MSESIPRHHYSDFANTVHAWMPMDDLARWQRNCKDPMQRNRLQQHGWLPEREITYCFNSKGFRSPEFDDRPSILCLGCSHTMGIGLPLEHTWPSILQQRLQINCWNLGIAGAALDTVFRIMDYYVQDLNPVAVLCLLPEIIRFELFTNGRPQVQNFGPNLDLPIFRIWIADDQNADLNRYKNLLAMQQICDVRNVPFVYAPCELENKSGFTQMARDLMHYGHAVQRTWAERFENMFFALQTRALS